MMPNIPQENASLDGARPVGGTRPKRPLSGVLLVDKPTGVTSQAVVSAAKRLYGAAKAGHTGTLDPMAGGLLPVCFGEATKFCRLLLDADKTYVATIRLGVTTTTGDNEGAVVSTRDVAVDRPAVERALHRFTGEILQTPPMYSAIKRAGKPLYAYARAGLHVERVPRKISIRSIELHHFAQDLLRITVTCGKGTYIRVLAEDIGHELGCGASLASLTRTAVGSYKIDAALRLDDLQTMEDNARDEQLLPVDSLVAALPRIDLDTLQAAQITTGRPVQPESLLSPGMVRVYGPGATYLGLASVEPHGAVVPRRLVATPARPA